MSDGGSMDSLLCDEVWLTPPDHIHAYSFFCGLTKQECEEGFGILLDKEKTYMPQPGYAHFLASSHNLALARFQAVQCLLKCGSRLRLSPETLFNAVNYLDRFLSLNQCNVWNYPTVQLVSVACLSIAAKFIDTFSPSLREIQAQCMMNEVLESSESIERIEVRVLEELGWRLSSTTAYSYVELRFSGQWHYQHLFHYDPNNFISTLTNILFTALLDPRLVEYRPCLIAASALKLLGAGEQFGLITSLIPHDFKGDLIKCEEIMEGLLIEQTTYNIDRGHHYNHHSPWSPVTVLLSETRVDTISDDDCVDDDGIGIISLPNRKRRKREAPLQN